MNQKRQPKGTTIGGQFAASKNPESNLALDVQHEDPYASWQHDRVGSLREAMLALPPDERVEVYFTARRDVSVWDASLGAYETPGAKDWARIVNRVDSEVPWTSIIEQWHDSINTVMDYPPDPTDIVESGAPDAKNTLSLLEGLDDDEPILAFIRTKGETEVYDEALEATRPPNDAEWSHICRDFEDSWAADALVTISTLASDQEEH